MDVESKVKRSSIPQKILQCLSTEKAPLTPLEVASKTGLNRNTVRRELQVMLKAKLVERDDNEHKYKVTSAPSKGVVRSSIKAALSMMFQEVAALEGTRTDPKEQKAAVEKYMREVKKGLGGEFGDTREVKWLINKLFGRREHRGLVTYTAELPEYFKEFAKTVNLDAGLKLTPSEEFDKKQKRDRREELLLRLVHDPYLLGDIRNVHAIRKQEMLEELEQTGMTREEIEAFVAKHEPGALRTIYDYWLDGMTWYRGLLARDIMEAERRVERNQDDVDNLQRWIEHAKQAYSDLQTQGKVIDVEPPEIPWLAKYEERVKVIAGERQQTYDASQPSDNIPTIELEEPLADAPVTIKVRKRVGGVNPRKQLKTTFGEAKTLIEQEAASVPQMTVPAPTFSGRLSEACSWRVVGRWKTRDDAAAFLTDAHHEDFPDSDYWEWKKANAEFAVIHWQGQYWPVLRVCAGAASDAPSSDESERAVAL